MKNPFDGFAVNLYLDEEVDRLAHFVERPEVSAFSETLARALDQFNVRIDKRIHRALAVEAARAGTS